MDKKRIFWDETFRSSCLNQAISSGIEFCMISDDDYQCSPFMYCKDYIQDAYQGLLKKKKRSIYGFT